MVGRLWRGRACRRCRGTVAASAAGASASTPSSSAIRVTSTCPPPGGSRVAGPCSSIRSSRSTRPSSRIAAASGPARPGPGSCVRSTGSHSGAPTSSSRTRSRTRATSPSSPGLPDERLAVCFVGAEERLFRPGWQPAEDFHALFVGKLIPLHGLETILTAARLAPEVPFRIVGSGQLDALLHERPPNVEWVDWVDYERLPEEIQRAGCALGVFGTSAKAGRVIPNKAFQALACGTPLVTGDTPAARELLRDGESALLVPPGDPDGAGCGRAPAARATRSWRESIGAGGLAAYRDAGERGRARRTLARPRRASSSHGEARLPSSGSRPPHSRASSARRPSFGTARSERPLRPREHDAGGLVDRARRLPLGHRRPRRADLPARLALRPDPGRARAALVGLAGPRAPARRARRSQSQPARSRSTGSRASTSAPSWPRCGTRRRLPRLPAGAVADDERLPSRRARVPAPPLRVVAPRRDGASGPSRCWPQRRSRRRSTSASPWRRWASGTPSGTARRARERQSSSWAARPLSSRRSSSCPTSHRPDRRRSRAGTTLPRSTDGISPISPRSCSHLRCCRSPHPSRCSRRCPSSGSTCSPRH